MILENDFQTEHGKVDYSYDKDEKTIEIELVIVDHVHRGKGLGTELMLSFFSHCLDNYDFHAVRLTVYDSRFSRTSKGLDGRNLIRWYSKLGFTIYDYVICNEEECPRMVILPFEMEKAK